MLPKKRLQQGVQQFRRQFGDQPSPRLEGYGERLIAFLNESPLLFARETQVLYYDRMLRQFFRTMAKRFEWKAPDGQKQPSPKDWIEQELAEWRAYPAATCFDAGMGKRIAGQSSGLVSLAIHEVLGAFKLSSTEVAGLTELAALFVGKDEIVHDVKSGLVVAGFGEDDVLPVMERFEVGDVYEGRLKVRRLGAPQRITPAIGSLVVPFAENEMADCFLNGINPKMELDIIDEVHDLGMLLPAAVVDHIPNMAPRARRALENRVLQAAKELVNSWSDSLKQKISENRSPIEQTIEFLPKDELAHVAASLVNLNSFQKRMSIDQDETVGGPIDVAVISKGDGFVWIKRKHYFDRDLNPHYFKNLGTLAQTRSNDETDKASIDSRSDAASGANGTGNGARHGQSVAAPGRSKSGRESTKRSRAVRVRQGTERTLPAAKRAKAAKPVKKGKKR